MLIVVLAEVSCVLSPNFALQKSFQQITLKRARGQQRMYNARARMSL